MDLMQKAYYYPKLHPILEISQSKHGVWKCLPPLYGVANKPVS
jgi:hypothetical protein